MSVQQQVKNQWGGYQPENEIADVCSACATDAGVRNLQESPRGKSQEELDAEARAIRDGTFKSPFARVKALVTGSPRPAILPDGTVTDPELARARGYDPGYTAYLQAEADKAEAEANAVFEDLPPTKGTQ